MVQPAKYDNSYYGVHVDAEDANNDIDYPSIQAACNSIKAAGNYYELLANNISGIDVSNAISINGRNYSGNLEFASNTLSSKSSQITAEADRIADEAEKIHDEKQTKYNNIAEAQFRQRVAAAIERVARGE